MATGTNFAQPEEKDTLLKLWNLNLENTQQL